MNMNAIATIKVEVIQSLLLRVLRQTTQFRLDDFESGCKRVYQKRLATTSANTELPQKSTKGTECLMKGFVLLCG